MSWTMWHEEGHGFTLSDCSIEKYVAFVKNHSNSLGKRKQRVLDVVSGAETRDDFFDYIRDEICDDFTIGEIIAGIMCEETGIRFFSPPMTEDGEEAVLFFRSYPWEYNRAEKQITYTKLLSLLNNYAKELGVEGTVDWIDLVYSG